MYCRHCQRIDPVPLESPAALEYFKVRHLAVPEHPQPPTRTPRQQRWRMAGTVAVLAAFGGFGALIDHSMSADASTTHAGSSAVAAARPTYDTDEFEALRNACGKPAGYSDKDGAAFGGKGAVQREVKYPRMDFLFLRNTQDAKAWTLTGAFPAHGDAVIDRTHALKLMPCLGGLHFQVGLRDEQ